MKGETSPQLDFTLTMRHEARKRKVLQSLLFWSILNTIAVSADIFTQAEIVMTSDAPAQFFDIEIRILNPQAGEYPVEITLEDGAVARGTVPRAALMWEAGGNAHSAGQHLFEMLLGSGRLREVWGAARSRPHRVRLRIDPPGLHALPWEFLHDGQVMLAASGTTPFSRYLPIDRPWGQPVASRPIRVLAVVSNPSDLQTKYDLPAVDVELEQQILHGALSGSAVKLDLLTVPVTVKRLEEQLREGYHVLHLAAHGAFNAKRQQAALFLQDETGAAQRIVDDDFVAMLVRLPHKPALIVLAACQSATRSAHDELVGLGPKLVQAGVPAVVAMQDLVTVATARQFSATLYDQLLKDAPIDLAVNQARGTLLTIGRPDAAVPVLFMRLKDGRLWNLPDRPQAAHSSAAVPAAPPASISAIDVQDQTALREFIVNRYDLEELRTLCMDIDVPYDDLRGEGKTAKARELIAYLKRRNRLNDLIHYLQQDRGK